MNTKTHFIAKYKVDGVEHYSTLKTCLDYVKGKKYIGLDIETTRKFPKRKEAKNEVYRGGLDPYLTNVVMLQLGDLENIFVIDVRDFTKKELKPIIDYLNWNSETTFVGVNLKFEGKHLRHQYDIRLKNVWDCMIVEMCLYNGLSRSYSLAGMSKEYLGVEKVEDIQLFEQEKSVTLNDEYLAQNENLLTPFEIANTEQIDKSTRMEFVTIDKKPFNSKQILYGSDDIIYPLLIMERQMFGRKLSDKEIYMPKRLLKLENGLTQVIADMELAGMPFDPEFWSQIADNQQVLYDERLLALNTYVEQHYPKFVEQPNLFGYEQKCTIEWTSSKQVVEFFRHLDACPKEFSKSTKKVDWTVGAVALLKTLKNEYKDAYMEQKWVGFDIDSNGKYIVDTQKFTLAYLLFKRSEQAVTTFGKEWLRYVHPVTKRVHTSFRQILNSGRIASSSPNIQQITNGIYRDAFVVDDKDKKSLIAADFSNQEVRTVADLADEIFMIDFFQKGHPIYKDDLHMLTANLMNKAHNPSDADFPPKGHPDFTKFHGKKRGEAKIISFGLLYGKEAKGFAEDFGLSKEEAQEFIDNYFGAYPSLKKSMDKWAKETFEQKYIKIDDTVDRRWFTTNFEVIEKLNQDVKKFYPPEYFERGKMSQDEKARIKSNLEQNHPEVKQMWRDYFGIKGSIERKSTNYKIQGTSASETKAALVMLRNELIVKNEKDILINICVHDEIIIECLNPNKEQEASEILSRNMTDGANVFLKNKLMKAEAVIGKTWVH